MTERNHVQLYGGIIMQDSTETDEEVAQGETRPATRKSGLKKGPKASQAGGDPKKNANGKRGRPRVDPQDESAVEVSQTQSHRRIRLFMQSFLTWALASKDTNQIGAKSL